MKPVSVKGRITLLTTLLTAALFGVLLAFAYLVSHTVVQRTARDQLVNTVRANVPSIDYTGGRLTTGQGFAFYQNGVTSLVYSSGEALLAGQLPVGFPSGEPFVNGSLRTVEAADTQYYLLDLWVASGWEDGVWLRGLLEVPNSAAVAKNLLIVAAIALPLFVLAAAAGSWWLVRRSLRGLDAVIDTAASIGEGRDLSRRIGKVPGGRELTRLAETFDGLLERLQASFEAERQFTADASHELRTPVAVIKSACECGAQYDDTPEERAETLAIIQRQADRMSGLIGQLLALTRLDQGGDRLVLAPLDLAALARRAAAELPGSPGRLRLELDEGITVRGDEALLGRLVANLVDNAFKYGPAEGPVTVRLRAGAGEALLTVADRGPGIPAEAQEKIWQRFYQLDAARGDERAGVGLGLSLVWRIAQLHGGRMTLDSAPGRGSAFTLHLPLA